MVGNELIELVASIGVSGEKSAVKIGCNQHVRSPVFSSDSHRRSTAVDKAFFQPRLPAGASLGAGRWRASSRAPWWRCAASACARFPKSRARCDARLAKAASASNKLHRRKCSGSACGPIQSIISPRPAYRSPRHTMHQQQAAGAGEQVVGRQMIDQQGDRDRVNREPARRRSRPRRSPNSRRTRTPPANQRPAPRRCSPRPARGVGRAGRKMRPASHCSRAPPRSPRCMNRATPSSARPIRPAYTAPMPQKAPIARPDSNPPATSERRGSHQQPGVKNGPPCPAPAGPRQVALTGITARQTSTAETANSVKAVASSNHSNCCASANAPG